MLYKYSDIINRLILGANPSEVYNELIKSDSEFKAFVDENKNKKNNEIMKEYSLVLPCRLFDAQDHSGPINPTK